MPGQPEDFKRETRRVPKGWEIKTQNRWGREDRCSQQWFFILLSFIYTKPRRRHPKENFPHVHHLQDNIHQSYLITPRDKKGILFILRAVVQSHLSALCVHSRLTSVLLRFNLDNKFQRGGGTESYVHEQTLENQSGQLPESALLSCSPQYCTRSIAKIL